MKAAPPDHDPPARASLAEVAYRYLEEAIVTLRLKPGEAVDDAAVAERLGVSRTPVREALLRLQEDRLISIQPRRGVFVTQIDILDYLDMLETRRALDTVLARTAARRASPDQREALAQIAARMRTCAEDGDLDGFMREDRAFDVLLYQASSNRSAVQAVMPMHSLSRRFWYAYRRSADLTTSAQAHAGIMDAVVAGDQDEAARATDVLHDYLERFARSILLR